MTERIESSEAGARAAAQAVDVRIAIATAIEEALGGGPPVALATVTMSGAALAAPRGAKLLVRPDGSAEGGIAGGAVDEALREVARSQITTLPRITLQTLWVGAEGHITDRRSQAREGDAQVMVEIFEAPARLVIVGGGHIGLAIARIGEIAGFEIAVLDDREEFANRDRFPMAGEIMTGDLGTELDAIALDASCYVVLVSRGHKQDEEGLRHVVGRGAAYVGMIGSRRRTHTVLQHLLDEGFDRGALEAVHTPIGIDIGAETPEEIAVSILAEIILVRRGGSGRRMSATRAPLGSGGAQPTPDLGGES